MRHLPVIIAVLCLAACSEPPVKEIAAAEAALAQARQAGADRFAPERWKEAEAALELARHKVQEKDYRGALSAASAAADKSRRAAQAAEAAKVLARSAAEMARAETEGVLDDVKAVRREAADAKVPDRVFEPLHASYDAANRGVETIAAAIERGEFGEARKLAVDIKAKIEPLPRLYREAMEKWQSAHGRRHPKAAARKP